MRPYGALECTHRCPPHDIHRHPQRREANKSTHGFARRLPFQFSATRANRRDFHFHLSSWWLPQFAHGWGANSPHKLGLVVVLFLPGPSTGDVLCCGPGAMFTHGTNFIVRGLPSRPNCVKWSPLGFVPGALKVSPTGTHFVLPEIIQKVGSS